MSGRVLVGAILLVGGIVLGFVGYNKSQPKFEENFASSVLMFGSVIGEDTQGDVENIKSGQFKRGLPFYVIGCIAGIAGIVLLVKTPKADK